MSDDDEKLQEKLLERAFAAIFSGEIGELTPEEMKLLPASISMADWKTVVQALQQVAEHVKALEEKVAALELRINNERR